MEGKERVEEENGRESKNLVPSPKKVFVWGLLVSDCAYCNIVVVVGRSCMGIVTGRMYVSLRSREDDAG